jgi:hypothetical protein
MRILVDGLGGKGRFDSLPSEGHAAAMQNSRFFKANTLSADPFPNLSKDKVKRLTYSHSDNNRRKYDQASPAG